MADLRPAEELWYGRFPENSTLFFTIHPTATIRDSLARIADDRRVRTVLAKTETVYGALTLTADEPPSYSFAAPGRYPLGLARCSLALSRAWKKIERDRWIARDGGAELVLSGRSLALSGTAPLTQELLGLEDPLPFSLPERVLPDLEGSEIFVYIEHFPQELAARITRVRLPLEMAWIAGKESDGEPQHTITAGFLLEEPRGVRVFSLGLKLMVTHFLRLARVDDLGERLKQISVESIGSEVRVEGLILKPEELERLVVSITGTEEA